MRSKVIVKRSIDVVMTFLFLMQMGYHMMDNTVHEWMGAALLCLFILHHALNAGWYRGLFRGKYSPQRVLLTAVDAALLIAMAAIIVSAVCVSRDVFDFLGLRLRAFGRQLHMPATMWAFVLMGLHLGLHWNIVLGMARKARGRKSSRVAVWLVRAGLFAIAGFGVYQFITRGLYMEMFMLREFAFLDYGESLWYFFASYAAVLAALVAASHYLGKAIRFITGRVRA